MRSDNQNFADDKGNADAKTMNSINSIATNQKMGSTKPTSHQRNHLGNHQEIHQRNHLGNHQEIHQRNHQEIHLGIALTLSSVQNWHGRQKSGFLICQSI
jgi:hypothetical protein